MEIIISHQRKVIHISINSVLDRKNKLISIVSSTNPDPNKKDITLHIIDKDIKFADSKPYNMELSRYNGYAVRITNSHTGNTIIGKVINTSKFYFEFNFTCNTMDRLIQHNPINIDEINNKYNFIVQVYNTVNTNQPIYWPYPNTNNGSGSVYYPIKTPTTPSPVHPPSVKPMNDPLSNTVYNTAGSKIAASSFDDVVTAYTSTILSKK